MAQPFNTDSTLTLTGEQVPIAEQVAFNSGLGRGSFSVSDNGVLAFRRAAANRSTAVVRSDGQTDRGARRTRRYFNIALSPVDEKHAAVDRTDPQTGTNDIWLFDLGRNGVSSRFTTDPAGDSYPLWSPDAKRIVFASYRTGSWSLYEKSASGGENEQSDSCLG